MYHLQNRPSVTRLKARLKERISLIPQRIVHPDAHFTMFAMRWIFEDYPRRKILRLIRPRVIVMHEFEQLDRVRMVNPLKSQRDAIIDAVYIHLLRLVVPERKQI